MAVPAIPIILQPSIRDREAGFLHYPLGVNGDGNVVIQYLLTFLANQIDVLFKVSFVAIFHLIKLKRFDDAVARKLLKRCIGGRQAQALFFLFCFLVDK